MESFVDHNARARQEIAINGTARGGDRSILGPNFLTSPHHLTSFHNLSRHPRTLLEESYNVSADQVAVRVDASASTMLSLQSRSLYPPPCANARTSYLARPTNQGRDPARAHTGVEKALTRITAIGTHEGFRLTLRVPPRPRTQSVITMHIRCTSRSRMRSSGTG